MKGVIKMKPAKESIDVGLLIEDAQPSLRFYKDLLGLKLIETRPVRTGTMYRLRFGSSDLKLIESKTKLPKGPSGLETQLGFRYVTFQIQGLSELCASLKAEGVEFVSQEKEIRPGVRIALVQDPAGNVVELFEQKN
jgi:catechol 2,3-dioxygenase-like lactoylglutathione lyase family enzyme